jgi:lipoprotein NlpI
VIFIFYIVFVYFNKSLALNPESAKTFYIRGLAHVASDNDAKACNDFKSAYDLGMTEASAMMVKVCK